MTEVESSADSSASQLRRGVMLGTISAVGYSAANLALRGLSGRHEDMTWSLWVTATKAVPTMLLAAFLLGLRFRRRESLFPAKRVFFPLLTAALLMQFGGNLGFQVALGHIGLAITVPLVFAFIIVAGAVLGKMYLGDSVSRRTVVLIAIMTLSIVLLSYAAWLNSSGEQATENTTRIAWFGVVMAIVSGTSYGINGAVIRGLAKNTLPIESMMIVYSTTGILCLGIPGAYEMGADRLTAITPDEWVMMLLAGIFNAIAFFSITHALKLMNISHVNVINASQNAMCAIAGVLMFAEPASPAMVAGIALSVVGLLLLDRK